MPKRSRSNDNDDDLERKNDESREVPVWLHSSPLYQMFLENAAADGGADDDDATIEGEGHVAVPRGAPLCAAPDCSDARLLYRTVAYWQLDFGAFPTTFFVHWFGLNAADRAQAVETVRAFHAELHPDTCCASMLQRDAHTVYSLWWSNAGDAPRRVRSAVVLEAVERGALRCVKVLHAVNDRGGGGSEFVDDDVKLWFHTALRCGHLCVADFLRQTHSVLNFYSLDDQMQVFDAVKASGNLAVYEWVNDTVTRLIVLQQNLCGIVRHHAAGRDCVSSAVEIVAWCYAKITASPPHDLRYRMRPVIVEAIEVADFAVLEWFLSERSTTADDLWAHAVSQPRVDVLEWLVQKAPLVWFDNVPLSDRGGYEDAAQKGNLQIMQWMHAHGVVLDANMDLFMPGRCVFRFALGHCEISYDKTGHVQRALAMVDWLLETAMSPDDRLRALSRGDAAFGAALHVRDGGVPLLQGLLDRGFQATRPQNMYRIAVEGGGDDQVPVLDWISTYVPMPPHDDDHNNRAVISATVWTAMVFGNAVALEWIHQHWSVDWRAEASRFKIHIICGAAATLQFLFEKGVASHASVLVRAMAFSSETARPVLKVLMDNDCAWNTATMVTAIRCGKLSVMKWLRAKGCPWISSSDGVSCNELRSAVCALEEKSKHHNGYLSALKWLRAQKNFPKHLLK